MKIEKLKINAFRGIVSFEAEANSDTLVVTGPNGTGKSGIIDSIDFLLTGDLQRLRGEGTAAIGLESHGKHVDKDIKDVSVAATVRDGDRTVEIIRDLQTKKLKRVSGDADLFEAITEKMVSGQFLLSRRELLKFIACTGQKRSEEIQALLDTSGIEKIRKDLQSSLQASERAVSGHQGAIESNLRIANSYLGLPPTADSGARRAAINVLRKTLSLKEISEWSLETDITENVPVSSEAATKTQKRSVFQAQVSNIDPAKQVPPKDGDGSSIKDQLSTTLDEIAKISGFYRLVAGNDLIIKGLEIVESNVCPLCDTDWEGRDLRVHLKQKKMLSDSAVSAKDRYDGLVGKYKPALNALIGSLKIVKQTLEGLGQAELSSRVSKVSDAVEARVKDFSDLKKMVENRVLFSSEQGLVEVPGFETLVSDLTTYAQGLPEETAEEKAQKSLHQVAALFKAVLESSKQLKVAKTKQDLMQKVYSHFQSSRDQFFSNLFTQIEADFVSYYKFLNQDEGAFTAKIVNQERTVDLQVDFYSRGLHPPHALHSEGHQDSMGICLFLALMKKIKADQFSLALLDDVMMSIDSGHRRRLCELIRKTFATTQFVITTHDPVWARQLKEFGVVKKKNLYHFFNWSLEAGPVFQTKEVWEILREKAKNGLIHDAAAGLRRTLEQEFQEICANFEAKVTFKAAHNWELGELKDAAVSTFDGYLSRAKEIANSRGNKDAVARLKAISDNLTAQLKQSRADDWQINPSVHYNEWGNFSKEEIIATINGLELLIKSFAEGDSKFCLAYTAQGRNPIAITTANGEVNFTLVAAGSQD